MTTLPPGRAWGADAGNIAARRRTLDELAGDLRLVLGADHVSLAEVIRAQHATGESYHAAGSPEVVVFPSSTENVVSVVDICRRYGAPLIPHGAGTSLEGHVVPLYGGVSLDTSRLDRILRLSVDDLDVTVEAGVRRKQLESRLQPEGVFFPVDPGADASIGGMIATGASGTTTVRYGAMRENVLSLTVVTPDARVVRTRSRARKSSAGYDLTRLFVGSEGTLGVITEATLRVYPTPEAITSAVCAFASLPEAVACVIQATQLGISVARLELLDEVQMHAVNLRSGLTYTVAPTLFLEFHGSSAEVGAQTEELAALARANGGGDFLWATTQDERRTLWAARHQAYEAALALRPGSKGFITDVCVPISALARNITEARADVEAAGLIAPIVGHVGDGNFHVCFLVDIDAPEEITQVRRLAERIAERAIEAGGTCTGEHGVGYGKRSLLLLEHGQEGVKLMRQIKQALDPDELMNPGKILPDL